METWKPLKNFPSYNGSTEGRIMNIRTQRIMRTYTNSKGYSVVCLRKNNKQYTVRVAKVIAETFLGEHPGMDVRYKDSDKSNVRVENLYWSTRSETIQSAFVRGTKAPQHRTPVRVVETKDIFESVAECGRILGVDKSAIFKCLRGYQESIKGYHFERV